MRCLGVTKQLKRCRASVRSGYYCRAHARQPAYWAIGFVVAVAASWVAVFLPQPAQNVQGLTGKADVRLVVGNRVDPRYWLYNPSQETARDPKYQFDLFNINVADERYGRMSLRIPSDVLRDFIHPRSGLGPTRLLDLSPLRDRVLPGHSVFGIATVQCSNCESVRRFWLYFKVGGGGWIAEIPASDVTAANKAFGRILHSRGDSLPLIESLVPSPVREPIP